MCFLCVRDHHTTKASKERHRGLAKTVQEHEHLRRAVYLDGQCKRAVWASEHATSRRLRHQDVSDICDWQTPSSCRLGGLIPIADPKASEQRHRHLAWIAPMTACPLQLSRDTGPVARRNPPGRPHQPDAPRRRVAAGPTQVAGAWPPARRRSPARGRRPDAGRRRVATGPTHLAGAWPPARRTSPARGSGPMHLAGAWLRPDAPRRRVAPARCTSPARGRRPDAPRRRVAAGPMQGRGAMVHRAGP
jgi:hypothetical protein